MTKKLTVFFFFIVLIFIAGFMYYNLSLKSVEAAADGNIITINIPTGANTTKIAAILQQNNLIRNSTAFRLYSKLNGLDSKYKAGSFEINNSIDVKTISQILQHGKGFTEVVKFTIPEGYEIRMIIDRLVELGLVDREKLTALLSEADFDYSFLQGIDREEGKLEGYLFPDTYEVYKGSDEQQIINKMLSRFDIIFNEEFKKRAAELNMSIDEVITLASIIEREARVEKDRKIISSAFHNRLKNKMMLQSCATVQYVLKERKEVLLYSDLEIKSPYNTYKNSGLPPGPIASPGLKSIEAALYPDDTEYLYFFAIEDGSHIFTKTFKEHLQAQNKYKK